MNIIRNLFKERINKVIKLCILADLLFWGGWSFLGPIFAVFVVNKIKGANVFIVGFLAGVYFLSKALFEVPISFYLDKRKGEKDDYFALTLGLFLAGTTAIIFLLSKDIVPLIFGMILQGFSFALYSTAWPTIFSRHLDKDFYSVEWALDHMGIDIVSSMAAFLGGGVAYFLGFEFIFIFSALLAYTSSLVLFFSSHLILPREKNGVFYFRKNYDRR